MRRIAHPLMGHVAHHVGAIQASHLLVQRLLAKLHASGIMMGAKDDNFCEKELNIRIKKSPRQNSINPPYCQYTGTL